MKGLDRVKRARTQLLQKHYFYAQLVYGVDMVASTEHPTFAVSTKTLFVNETFADTLTDAQLRGVLVHEIMHLAGSHHVRKGNREHVAWNEATDYRINYDLIEQGFELPDGALYDASYADMTPEAIYAARERQKEAKGGQPGFGQGSGTPKPGNGPGEAPCGFGEVLPCNPATIEEETAKWNARVLSAAAVASRAGDLPGCVKRLVDEIRNPSPTDWRAMLAQFVDQSVSKSESWSRVNRRFVGQGLYLPGQVSDAAAHMILAIDVSGSIDKLLLQTFVQEAQSVLDSGAVDKITVICCDTRMSDPQEFTQGELLKIDVDAGGGTSFRPVMEWAATQEAACLIYFTDLDCRAFGNEPPMPVLWAAYGNSQSKPPFGTIVQVDRHS